MWNLNYKKLKIKFNKIKKVKINKIRNKPQGVKIRIGGRLGGVNKAKFRKFNKGFIKTSTMTQPLFYNLKHVHTKWGIMGFKIWKSI